MLSMKIASIIGLMLSLALPGAKGSIYTVSDSRIRGMDISPVLGRGYSIMTNQFYSTCLMVDETTVPSYNYKFFYWVFNFETVREPKSTSDSNGSSHSRFSFQSVESEYLETISRQSSNGQVSRLMSTTMSIERYYSSVREEKSPLAADAVTLLNEQDYVGFFKACGPNYTRGIRRAQEVTSMLSYQCDTQETAEKFESSFKKRKKKVLGLFGSEKITTSDVERSTKFSSIESKLEIKIVGFGLGLTQQGSDSIVATTMEDYDAAMKFAFKAMTRNSDAYNIGMVYGVEVVPWVQNTAWQVAAKLGDENIEVPMPRSLIPRAYIEADPDAVWDINGNFRCKDASLVIDKYGYCCELEQLYNPVLEEYTGSSLDRTNNPIPTHVCKPIYSMDPNLIKDNMSNNAEFVARLDSALRYKLAAISTLESCISAVNSIPTDYLYHKLKTQDSVKYDGLLEAGITVVELKMAIDPKGDYSIVKHMAMELDEWIEMYYSPCYAAFYGTNVGTTPDTEVSYFMAYPWYSHDECMRLSCITNNQRWDRSAGGCTPSMISGKGLPYIDGEDEYCAKKIDRYDIEDCKYSQAVLRNVQSTVTSCSSSLPANGQVDYLINYFCNPQVTTTRVSSNEQSTLAARAISCAQ